MMELKPCPFCGGEAKKIVDARYDTYDVSCKDVHCFAYRGEDEARFYESDDAETLWNRRVGDDLMERMEDDGK
jgi:hypothetical protein